MYQSAFTKLELAETATILDRVGESFDGTIFDPVETTMLVQDISFYPGYQFLDIADHASKPPIQRFVILGQDDFFVINFSNEPIYDFNKKLPISLSEDNITDYVRFFFTYVRGRHGRFIIAENVDDIDWKEDPPPSARKALGEILIPITLEKTDKSGTFHMRVCMVFKDSLFKTLVKVESNGFISMSEEELLVEDMPVLDDTFGQ